MMKRTMAAGAIAGTFFLALGPGQALAQVTCPNPLNGLTPATAAEIATVLGVPGNLSCINASSCTGVFAIDAADNNHEVIVGSATGGTVYDKKQGTNATDPAGAVGTYTISTSGTFGNITYTYPSGSFTFCVSGSAYTAGSIGAYTFYDGSNHSVALQNGD